MTSTWVLVAETTEWVGPIAVTQNGSAVTSFEVALAAGADRPAGWASADADPSGGTGKGVLVGAGTGWPLAVGVKYTVYVRWTDGAETPVLKAGYLKVV